MTENRLTAGKIVVGNNKAWIGPNGVELTKDTIYSHPTNKQCNYEPDLSNYATKDDLASVSNVVDGVALKAYTTLTCPQTISGTWYTTGYAPFSWACDSTAGYNYIWNKITNTVFKFSTASSGGNWSNYETSTGAVLSYSGSANTWYFFHVDSGKLAMVTINMTANTMSLRNVTLTNYANYFRADYDEGQLIACNGSTLWWSTNSAGSGNFFKIDIPSSSTWNCNSVATTFVGLDNSYTWYWGTAYFSSTAVTVYAEKGSYGYLINLTEGNRTETRQSSKTTPTYNNPVTNQAFLIDSTATKITVYRVKVTGTSTISSSTVWMTVSGGNFPLFNATAAPTILGVTHRESDGSMRMIIKYTGKTSGTELIRYYQYKTSTTSDLIGVWQTLDNSLLTTADYIFYVMKDPSHVGLYEARSSASIYLETPYQYKTESSLPLIQD